jgi:PGF-CTERM protein
MSSPVDRRSTVTRRELLGGAVGVAATVACVPGAGQASTVAMPTVMTQNVYVGADLLELVEADSAGTLLLTLGEFLDQLDPNRYAARARGIAAAVAETSPDVVALQEVGTIQLVTEDGESEVVVDVLSRIESALEAEGLAYEVAAGTVTTAVELPGVGDLPGLRLENRDVVLVDDDHSTTGTATDTYDATVTVDIPDSDRDVTVTRGYAAVDVTVGDAEFTAVSTHLASSSRSTRRKQAEELLAAVPADRPVVLGGDFNSGPGTTTDVYGLLTSSFGDPFAMLRPDEGGFTCCQAADLENAQSQLDKRIDAVLVRGQARPTAVRRVGHRPEDRVTFESDDGPVDLWPSDHAGVVTTFEMGETPTPTPTDTPAPTPTPVTNTETPASDDPGAGTDAARGTDTDTPDDADGPGFGVVSALAALGGVSYLWRRFDRQE